MPGTPLRTLNVWIHLNPTITLCSGHHSCPHFTDEDTEAQMRLNNLPKVGAARFKPNFRHWPVPTTVCRFFSPAVTHSWLPPHIPYAGNASAPSPAPPYSGPSQDPSFAHAQPTLSSLAWQWNCLLHVLFIGTKLCIPRAHSGPRTSYLATPQSELVTYRSTWQRPLRNSTINSHAPTYNLFFCGECVRLLKRKKRTMF